MTYGAYFIADDGSLLVSSEQPCYEYVDTYTAASRSGNVNTYNVPIADYPLVLINCGTSGKAGLLAIEGSSGAWVISVLADAAYGIKVFKVIGGTPSGYGLATFSSTGSVCFDSSKKILNAKAVTTIGSGITASTPTGTDMVAYTSGQVQANKSVSEDWVFVEEYLTGETVYICEPQYVCDFDIFGGYWCTYQTVCRFEYITSYISIYAKVRTTNWTLDRGVAKMNSGSNQVTFDWLRHKEGYYKEILSYTADVFSSGGGVPAPIGYTPTALFFVNTETFSGELTKNNTYPYSETFNNMVNLTCITATGSDYV